MALLNFKRRDSAAPTIVNGEVVYRDGELTKNIAGQRLEFARAR